MSEHSDDEKAPAGRATVSMRKESSASAGRPAVPRITPPKTVDLACGALAVTVVALVVRGLTLLGFTGTLDTYLININNNADKPKKPYNPAADLHQLRSSTLLNLAVVGIALVLLIFALRRTRSASGSRWALLIVLVFTQLPAYVIPISGGWPPVAQVFGIVAGIACIAALVLVFLRPSAAYFRACREASLPPERRGQPRPGLAGMFGPRPPRAARAGASPRGYAATRADRAGTARSAGNPSASNPSASKPAAGKARAKVRADADAVSRGAELARSRAKASKSRRTER